MIYWKGRSTNGACRYKAVAGTFINLFNDLINREIIIDHDTDIYDDAVLEKYNKSYKDKEFRNKDDELDYEKVREFVESHNLTDEELWLLIAHQNGNAYYQTFEREDENEKMKLVEIDKSDFDESGKYLYA